MGLPNGNQTIHHHLLSDDQVIIAQDKGDAEYDTKINRRMSEMGLICKYEGHFLNNSHNFLITDVFYFRKYLFTILLCSPPASQ
jgi:hypothetical protein